MTAKRSTARRLSGFGVWFLKQYGPRPRMGNLTPPQLHALVREGQMAEATLKAQAGWDDRQTAALYGWQANPKDRSKT